MGTQSKAREEGLVKRVAIDIDVNALARMEQIAEFLGITRSEMTRRLMLAAIELPLSDELWQLARKERPRKVFRVPRRHATQTVTA
jgi:hypothetical protein